MEHTNKLMQAFPDRVAVLAVSQDGEETRERAIDFLRRKGYPFVLLFDDERTRDLFVNFVPARFLIDRNGVVRIRESGWTPSQEALFEKKLRTLLEER